MLMLIAFLENFCREWRDEQAGKNAETSRVGDLMESVRKLEERVELLTKSIASRNGGKIPVDTGNGLTQYFEVTR
jgi:hypothetical protein